MNQRKGMLASLFFAGLLIPSMAVGQGVGNHILAASYHCNVTATQVGNLVRTEFATTGTTNVVASPQYSVTNSQGELPVTACRDLTNSFVAKAQSLGTSCDGHAIRVIADGSSGTPTINLTVDNTAFTRIDGASIEARAEAGGVVDLNTSDNTHDSVNGLHALRILSGTPGSRGNSSVTFDVKDITVTRMDGSLLSLEAAHNLEGRITVDDATENLLDGGGGNRGRGIQIFSFGGVTDPNVTILIENTRIRNTTDGGILLRADLSSSVANLTIQNNTIGDGLSFIGGHGIDVIATRHAVNLLIDDTSIENISDPGGGVDIVSRVDGTLNATVTGNSLLATFLDEFTATTTDDASASLCLDLDGNVAVTNFIPGMFVLTETNGTGTFTVTDLLTVGDRNTGTVNFVPDISEFDDNGGPCATPSLPTNP